METIGKVLKSILGFGCVGREVGPIANGPRDFQIWELGQCRGLNNSNRVLRGLLLIMIVYHTPKPYSN